MCLCTNVFGMFFAYLIFTETAHFALAIAFALWPFLAVFKMLSFFEKRVSCLLAVFYA